MKERTRTLDKILFAAALLLGSIAVVWIGWGFADSDALAFTVTAIIGCVYGIGCVELMKYRQATATLANALAATHEKVDDLNGWLGLLDPSLRNAVRQRVEGERVGLPAPILTPYLVGLLVMLGLLGTFVGMVDTLRGAVVAIEGTTELQAIREGIAAPIKGLGLAFGTSVAGVAASAMLGLMSTLCRRHRIMETGLLDTKIAVLFREQSLAHSQRETLKALQLQTQALPAVANKLDAMADKLGRLGETLVENQNRHHASVKANFIELTDSMDSAFKANLSENVRLAGETIRPILQDAVAGFKGQFQDMAKSLLDSYEKNTSSWLEQAATGDRGRLELWADTLDQAQKRAAEHLVGASKQLAEELKQATDTHQASLESAANEFVSISATLTDGWQNMETAMRSEQKAITASLQQAAGEFADCARAAVSQMQDETHRVLASSEKLVLSRNETEVAWIDAHHQRMDALGASLRTDLSALREDEERRGQAAVERFKNLESVLTSHLKRLGEALEAPMSRLIESAAQAPLAAAQVIDQLREEASKRLEQDHRLLEDHRRVIEELGTLSNAMVLTAFEQRDTIAQLVNASKQMMEDVGHQFSNQVDTKVSVFTEVADTFAGSAVEMASLGDAFSAAVELFNASNGELMDNLTRIEASLDKAVSRSDDQLGYYVAQAKEMIDHSLLSQREIVDALQQLRINHTPPAEVD